MGSARHRDDEAASLTALRALEVLDSAPEAEFDALVRAASLVCGTPISLISLIDAERQWFKANIGLTGVSETPRNVALCAHAVLGDALFEVPDAALDARFAANPLVVGQPGIRFYAGAPLRLSDGSRVGTLCVIDREPRRLTDMQREVLRCLALAAAQALEGRSATRAMQQAACAVADSEARFRTLSDGSPLGVYYTDAQGECTYTNRRWQEIHGLTLAQSLGQGWAKTLHPQDQAAVYAEWQRSAAERVEFDMEFRIVRGDGTLRQVRSRARAVIGDGVVVIGHVGSVEDVTEHHAMLARLAANEERLRRLYEATPGMLHSIDANGMLLTVSDAWLARLGYSRGEVIGRSLHDFLTPSSRAYARDTELPAFFETGRSDKVEYQMLARSGAVVDVLLSAILERAADGRPLRSLAVIEDVTLRRRAERALVEEHRRLDHIIVSSHAGTWEWNVQTGAVRFNERWAQIIGHTLAELAPLSAQTWLDHSHPDDLVRCGEALEQHFAARSERYECELRMRHRDGHWVWVLARGRVMTRLADGKPEWMFGTHQDITERVAERLALQEANERVALATESGRIGIWDWDLVTGAHVLDPWMYRLYDVVPRDDLGGHEIWTSRLHPHDRAAFEDAVRDAIEGGKPFDAEFRIVWSDGSIHHLRGTGRVTRDAAGRAVRMVGANWDVTESRRLSAELAEQHELLRVTLQSIGDAVITTDAAGHVVWLNPVAERMTGWPTADAKGRPLTQVFHVVNEATRAPAENLVATCLAEGKVVGLANHTLLISRNGDEYGIEDSAAPIRNDRGEALGVVMVFHDVSEQRRLSGEMSYRATHDALTGLVNRAEFETRLRRALGKAHDDHSQHALLYVDLDQFKLVNDACGHAVGDQLLQQIAKLLTDAVRARDTLARLGGDEFAIILEHCSTEQAQRVAQKICDRMDDYRFSHDGRRFRIGTSIGLVPVDKRWTGTAAILQAADTSCYAAKEAGRNRVHAWFDTDLAMRARHGEMQWATRIEQALDENRFVLYAQRIEALRDEPPGVHAEVLLRMVESDGALVAPGAFLPAAERFHLASRIDRWVLGRAIAWMKAAPSLEAIENLSVNLSGQSVGDRAFHRWAIAVLADAGAQICRKLCFEITETAAVTNLADAALFIEQVRAVGVRVALDDFGAGASSFGYLKTMPVDYLKIDGQFIRDLVTDPLDEAAVRCFADVAKVVGMKTVAEFVDDPAVLERLRAIGIDYAQGFLIHRPAPIDELLGVTVACVG